MIEYDIPFVNYDGEKVTEKFHFHLHLSELAELEVSYEEFGGFEEHFRNLVKTKNSGMKILEMFKDLMLRTVGRREGKLFIKNKDVREEFEFSGAYSAMFLMLQLDEIDPVAFFNGVMPADLHDKAKAVAAKRKELEEKAKLPLKDKKPGDYTLQELLDMPDDEFVALKKESRHNAPQNLIIANFQRENR